MITQCSHCSTKFDISRELVESDDPRVRCGECLKIFNARVQLVVEEPFSEPEIPTVTQKVEVRQNSPENSPVNSPVITQPSPAAELENYISVEDLENAATLALDDPPHAPAPAAITPAGADGFYSPDEQLDYGTQRQRNPHVDHLTPDDRSTSEFEQTLSLAENKHDNSTLDTLDPTLDRMSEPEIDPDFAPPIDKSEMIRERRSRRSGSKRSADSQSAAELRKHISQRGGKVLPVESELSQRRARPKSMFLPLTCVALALAATAYFARDQIAQFNLPEPLLVSFCGLTGCELPAQADLSRLELLQHKMNIHSKREDVLVINVDMINNAPFRQPYPVFAITMSDSAGEVVAERKFQPADYLEPDAIDQTLPSAEPVRIRFEILDPGPEAVSSELEFE